MATYDLATAEAMLASGRYLYVLFCSQQAVEKLLKAIIVERSATFPPRTHDLVQLAQVATVALSEEQDLFLRKLTKYYIGTRYPEEISALAKDATRELVEQSLLRTKDVVKWLETLRK
ncbi:MAG: HEPN domain-containing protein [Nitrospirae bacterium]|nr:HEPN domain-containing protein [Nitrospirota bacterium]